MLRILNIIIISMLLCGGCTQLQPSTNSFYLKVSGDMSLEKKLHIVGDVDYQDIDKKYRSFIKKFVNELNKKLKDNNMYGNENKMEITSLDEQESMRSYQERRILKEYDYVIEIIISNSNNKKIIKLHITAPSGHYSDTADECIKILKQI